MFSIQAAVLLFKILQANMFLKVYDIHKFCLYEH